MSGNTDNHAWREYLITVQGVTYEVRVDVNLRSLAHNLIHKAIRNKSKQTKLAHRAVRVAAVQQ